MTAAAERGTTTVTGRAVRRIAERAAYEAPPGAGAVRATRSAVSVRGRRARVALRVTLPYPVPLAETVRGVREHVAARTGELSGLDVARARIEVTALSPVGPAPAPAGAKPSGAGRAPRRLWSARRFPVAVLTASAAVVCALLAADLVLVRAGGRPAAAWRVRAVDWLAAHGPGDPSVLAAGVLTGLLGLVAVVLAVTPGLRGRATVRTPAPRVTAAVDRGAVEGLVRDAVGAVAGVGRVRVRVRGRRAVVRAGLLFGDLARARAEAAAAAGGALSSCGLRRVPRLRVRVAPEDTWQPPVREAEPSKAAVTGTVAEGAV